MKKSPDAFRTISEVAEWLETPAHVLRFWESRFTQVKPVKRAGGRRYYRPSDMALLGGIKKLLHEDGMTIRGVQKILREQGVKHVSGLSQPMDVAPGGGSESRRSKRPQIDIEEAQEAPILENAEPEPQENVVPLRRPEDGSTGQAGQMDLFGGAAPEAAESGTPAPDAADSPAASEDPELSEESVALADAAPAQEGEKPAKTGRAKAKVSKAADAESADQPAAQAQPEETPELPAPEPQADEALADTAAATAPAPEAPDEAESPAPRLAEIADAAEKPVPELAGPPLRSRLRHPAARPHLDAADPQIIASALARLQDLATRMHEGK